MRQLLETDQKALEINLDPEIYGTFAEIGAGQEVTLFLQVGAAAGTIAKDHVGLRQNLFRQDLRRKRSAGVTSARRACTRCSTMSST